MLPDPPVCVESPPWFVPPPWVVSPVLSLPPSGGVSGDRGIYESDVDNKSLKNDVTCTCEFIVFPQSLDNNKMDIEFEVADNGTINTYTTSLPSSTNNEFKGGYLYTYTISINNTGVVIDKAGITGWLPSDEGGLDAEQQ